MTGEQRPEFGTLQYWANLLNSQPHAGFFARDNQSKSLVELGTGEAWSVSVFEEFGVQISALAANSSDPPDLVATFDGADISIELVELLTESVRARSQKSIKNGQQPSILSGQNFEDSFWDQEKFEKKMHTVINKKEVKLSKHELCVDYLVVHSAELLLYPTDVQDWLRQFQGPDCEFIRNVHLLLDYKPGGADHWPVFDVPIRFKGAT